MFNGPRADPVRPTQMRFSHPELGAARKIHAVAPRNGGVTNAAKTSIRISPRPGMSVRPTAQASTVPEATAITATADARMSEWRMGCR